MTTIRWTVDFSKAFDEVDHGIVFRKTLRLQKDFSLRWYSSQFRLVDKSQTCQPSYWWKSWDNHERSTASLQMWNRRVMKTTADCWTSKRQKMMLVMRGHLQDEMTRRDKCVRVLRVYHLTMHSCTLPDILCEMSPAVQPHNRRSWPAMDVSQWQKNLSLVKATFLGHTFCDSQQSSFELCRTNKQQLSLWKIMIIVYLSVHASSTVTQ